MAMLGLMCIRINRDRLHSPMLLHRQVIIRCMQENERSQRLTGRMQPIINKARILGEMSPFASSAHATARIAYEW